MDPLNVSTGDRSHLSTALVGHIERFNFNLADIAFYLRFAPQCGHTFHRLVRRERDNQMNAFVANTPTCRVHHLGVRGGVPEEVPGPCGPGASTPSV